MNILFDRARKQYEERGEDFAERIAWHHERGFVIDIPELFAFGYFLKDENEMVCHVTYCIGDMKLLILIGENYVLDKIEFERNFSGRTKKYDIRKLKKRIK